MTITENFQTQDARVIVVCIEEALERLGALPSHPSRTLAGCHLLEARLIAQEWVEAGGYE